MGLLIQKIKEAIGKKEYPSEYIPKLHYWCSELHKNIAKENVDMVSVHYCIDKLNYFENRQSHIQNNNINKDVSF